MAEAFQTNAFQDDAFQVLTAEPAAEPTSYDPEEVVAEADEQMASLSAAQLRAYYAAVQHEDDSPDGIYGDGGTESQARSAAVTATGGAPLRRVRLNSHEVRTFLQILDRDEQPLGELRDILDGAVSFDASQVPDRMLDATVLDPGGHLLPHSPHDEAVEARRFVRAIYERKTRTGWVRFNKFTGPITQLERDGAQVTLRAIGKESLYLDPFLTWEAHNHPRKLRATTAIRRQAAAQGERKFRLQASGLPSLQGVLGRPVHVPRYAEAWPVMARMARQIGHRLFFDGRGCLALKPLVNRRHQYTFTDQVLLSVPVITDEYDGIRNEAVVRGPDPQGCQLPRKAERAITGASPISPRHMARNGVPRRAVVQDEIGSRWQEDLEAHARSLLRGFYRTVTFDCLPMPSLNTYGVCRVRGRFEGQWMDERFVLRKYTLPLTITEPMTIGDWRRLPVNYGAGHRRRVGLA